MLLESGSLTLPAKKQDFSITRMMMSNQESQTTPQIDLEALRDPKTGKIGLAPRQFSAVKKAREVLRGRALEILEKYLIAADSAIASGKYEEGLKAYQWLLDHVPDDEGQRILGPSVDKPQPIESKQSGPLIQIGFKLGGIEEIKQLPAITIEGEKV